jgi:hypothetical protein
MLDTGCYWGTDTILVGRLTLGGASLKPTSFRNDWYRLRSKRTGVVSWTCTVRNVLFSVQQPGLCVRTGAGLGMIAPAHMGADFRCVGATTWALWSDSPCCSSAALHGPKRSPEAVME